MIALRSQQEQSLQTRWINWFYVCAAMQDKRWGLPWGHHLYCATAAILYHCNRWVMCQCQMFLGNIRKAYRPNDTWIKLSAAHMLAVINYLKQKSTIFLDHHNECENVTEGLKRQMPVCMCVVVDEQTWYGMFWYAFRSMHQQSLQCVGTLMGSDQTKNLRRTWW